MRSRVSPVEVARRGMCALLLGMTVITACSPSTHAGVTTVPQPEVSDSDVNRWLAFYRDQFDAFKGSVLPPTDSHPEAAKQAYQRAAAEWADKVNRAQTNTYLLGAGIGLAAVLLITLVATASTPDYSFSRAPCCP